MHTQNETLMDARRKRVARILELGTETEKEQLGVLLDALSIFQQRGAVRGDLWKQAGWPDSVLHIRSKAMRIAVPLDRLSRGEAIDRADLYGVMDDAYDLINYCAFYIRLAWAAQLAPDADDAA